jgi:cytosolic carboxypeptidase protein 2/3
MYCDLHGHSRKKNIFMYGNNFQDNPVATRVFPYILSKLCGHFSFEDCRFSSCASKESTARVAMWRELNIPNVFTMETSFCGADIGPLHDKHFQLDHLTQTGHSLLKALLVYCKIETTESELKLTDVV